MTFGTVHIPKWVLMAMVALALLVESLLVALPLYDGAAYRGINIAPIGNDEFYYLGRAKAVLDGRPLGQAFISGVSQVPDSFMSDVEYVYMMPLRVLGLAPYIDVPTLYNILNTVGVFLLLLLIYIFVFALSEDVFLSAAAAIFVIGGYFWIENGTVVYMLLKGQSIFGAGVNIFGRSTDPYTALVPFFGFLICTYRALFDTEPETRLTPAGMFSRLRDSSENIPAGGVSECMFKYLWPYRFVIGAGILFGILFYDYFYAWAFALATVGSLTLTSLAWKRWCSALTAILIGGIGLVLGSYQLYNYYSFYTSEIAKQVSFFLLSAHSHTFIQSSTGLAALALFCVYWYFRRDDKNNFFLAALILAGWVALEQQLITGRMVQYGHFYWYFVVPLSIIVAVYMGVRLIGVYSAAWAKWASIAIIIAAFINTIGGQYEAFFQNTQDSLRQQDFAPILQKLQQSQAGVILGDPGGSAPYLLPAVYTADESYFSYAGIVNVFPIERMKEALLVYLYLNKNSRRNPVAYLQSELATSRTSNYTDMYETLEAYYAGIPLQDYRTSSSPRTDLRMLTARATFLPQIGKEYRQFANSPQHVRDLLVERGVHYILWDERAYPEWDPSVLSPLTVLATSTDVTLYSLSTTP